MPGVADQVRRTQLTQDQKRRKQDMNEIAQMITEGRLHEADERQLETIRMIAELKNSFGEIGTANISVNVDNQEIIQAIKQAVNEAVASLPVGAAVSPAADPNRPKMGHTSLGDLVQGDDDITISHSDDLGEEQVGTEDSTDKLEKLRKLKRT